MWPVKTILFGVGFWAACLMSLFNPLWGLVTYLLVYQTDPTGAWWGMPLAKLGIRFSLVAALFTIAGLITARRRVPRVQPGLAPWEICVLALFLIACINIVLGVGFGPSARWELNRFWKVLLFTIILARLAASRENLHWVLWTLVAGCLYQGWDAYGAPMWAFVLGRLDGFGGSDFSTTSGAAAHLSAMLPLIGVAFLIARNWWWRIFAAVSGALTVNAIIMCRTRSAFVGLVCGMLTAFLAAPRARRYRIHALLVAGCAMTFALTDDHFWQRMNTLADQSALETDRATMSRKEIWTASLRILEDYPLGVGVGNFTQIIGDYDPRHVKRSAHNSLLVCLVELGVQGGLLFLLIVACSIRLLYRSSRLAGRTRDPLETQIIAYGMLISLVTYFVTSLGTERFYCESFWWVLALPLALNRVVVRELQQAPMAVLEPLNGGRYESQPAGRGFSYAC